MVAQQQQQHLQHLQHIHMRSSSLDSESRQRLAQTNTDDYTNHRRSSNNDIKETRKQVLLGNDI